MKRQSLALKLNSLAFAGGRIETADASAPVTALPDLGRALPVPGARRDLGSQIAFAAALLASLFGGLIARRRHGPRPGTIIRVDYTISASRESSALAEIGESSGLVLATAALATPRARAHGDQSHYFVSDASKATCVRCSDVATIRRPEPTPLISRQAGPPRDTVRSVSRPLARPRGGRATPLGDLRREVRHGS